ncbi:hypothetical protein [Aquisphaera insulae]|uniref:hypothetical protein n=1 Tax=Aquisphaera insulae TaxID=2712864 RepID=UPI0013ED8FCC|nr:hypothetical protein [Aquisphaera insulae]
MRSSNTILRGRLLALIVAGAAATCLIPGGVVRAGKLSWLDDVVREVIAETKAGGKAVLRGGEAARAEARGAGRLFVRHDAEEGLEQLVKRSDDLARAGRKLEQPSEALLEGRFARLLSHDAEAARSFRGLKPAEKRLVVEMGEAAQRLARRYPQEAEAMARQLGPEGLTAVRVFGDDVAEVIAKEGPESLNVLRKTGRGGWEFFTSQVLPHKKKLLAAGVLAAFLADPDKFVDYAGKATEYAAHEFARAGISLATAVGSGAASGLESSIGAALAARGLNQPAFRYAGMALASVIAIAALFVLVGIPVRIILRPFTIGFGIVNRLFKSLAGIRTT